MIDGPDENQPALAERTQEIVNARPSADAPVGLAPAGDLGGPDTGATVVLDGAAVPPPKLIVEVSAAGTSLRPTTDQAGVLSVPADDPATAPTFVSLTEPKLASAACAHLKRTHFAGASTIHSADDVSGVAHEMRRMKLQPAVWFSTRSTTAPGTTRTDAEIASPGRTFLSMVVAGNGTTSNHA